MNAPGAGTQDPGLAVVSSVRIGPWMQPSMTETGQGGRSGSTVSIVTPSLNQAPFLGAAIESVLSQDYPRIEYLVVDGGSTDGTVDILRGHGGRLRWLSEPDAGQTAAVNKGFRLTTGEIIGWLNSDDLYVPGAVRAAVTYLDQHPDIDVVYGDADHIDGAGRIVDAYPTEPFDLGRLRETCFICQPAAFFRRRLIDRVGLLDESLYCGMDYEFWIRAGRRGRLGYLPVRLALSRLHSGAKTVREYALHQRTSIEIVRRHFGRVPASWLCAYAGAVVAPWAPRRTALGRGLYLAAVSMLSVWLSWRINHGLPPGALGQWWSWLRRSRLASLTASDVVSSRR
jgi:glycosyltransferase involved in cell wall biosynthesis